MAKQIPDFNEILESATMEVNWTKKERKEIMMLIDNLTTVRDALKRGDTVIDFDLMTRAATKLEKFVATHPVG